MNLKSKSHELKILPKYFRDVKRGVKKFELRKNDRNYKVGDYIKLCEYNGEAFTGEFIWVKITYILSHEEAEKFGLRPDYCILGFEEKKN